LRVGTKKNKIHGGAVITTLVKNSRHTLDETHRVNKSIIAKEVRVIGEDGKQLGIMPTHIAVRIAEEKGLDLVEVNPKAAPPVCKIIDHGRFKYEEARKKRVAKKKQTVVTVKEIKLRPKTDTHDLEVKIRAIMRFLADGNKAKLVIVFRGREIVHPDMGKNVLLKVLAELAEYAVVEQMPLMEGRRMTMLIAPKPGVTIPVRKKGEMEKILLKTQGEVPLDKVEDDVEDDLDDEDLEEEESAAESAEESAEEAPPP
jgi:translation initiation factor IF-3